jgi:hypothetical protein
MGGDSSARPMRWLAGRPTMYRLVQGDLKCKLGRVHCVRGAQTPQPGLWHTAADQAPKPQPAGSAVGPGGLPGPQVLAVFQGRRSWRSSRAAGPGGLPGPKTVRPGCRDRDPAKGPAFSAGRGNEWRLSPSGVLGHPRVAELRQDGRLAICRVGHMHQDDADRRQVARLAQGRDEVPASVSAGQAGGRASSSAAEARRFPGPPALEADAVSGTQVPRATDCG